MHAYKQVPRTHTHTHTHTHTTAVQYLRINNQTLQGKPSYSVRVKGMRYGGHDILFFGDGGDPYIDGAFDTGSSCVMLPDSQFGSLEASPFRALLEAHMLHGRKSLEFVLEDFAGATISVELKYDAWTHPGGCLSPYDGKRVVFGLPVFRRCVCACVYMHMYGMSTCMHVRMCICTCVLLVSFLCVHNAS